MCSGVIINFSFYNITQECLSKLNMADFQTEIKINGEESRLKILTAVIRNGGIVLSCIYTNPTMNIEAVKESIAAHLSRVIVSRLAIMDKIRTARLNDTKEKSLEMLEDETHLLLIENALNTKQYFIHDVLAGGVRIYCLEF